MPFQSSTPIKLRQLIRTTTNRIFSSWTQTSDTRRMLNCSQHYFCSSACHQEPCFHANLPFLAWSNAPGASLQEFLGRGLSEQVISGGGEGDSQLRLDSTSEPLCQTGISSLLMFDLPESEHKSN
ncbi:hypothetical protein PSTT_16165 [Puccinia striiformis]|uniref:Uncharacterized protein n=1 Tax=Puccinia striiformis TaxID=27350 RepID=A0A2S4UEC6_9BASI|nr:hypothetical protein PSTT_16165 [Puccinia striiformis]